MKHVQSISRMPKAQVTIPWSAKVEALAAILQAAVPLFNAKQGITTT